jgi:hypothetical protein
MPSWRTFGVAGAGLAAFLVARIVVFWDDDVEKTRRTMLAAHHPCPPGAVEQVERAGEGGWLRLCARNGVRHGPFAYWKKQRKHAEGSYVDGKLARRVTTFDDHGRVVRVEEHPG